MNVRFSKCAEDNIVDAQNGFCCKRSCEDHIFVLLSIIRQRKAKRLHTYIAFIDMEKVFDCVVRNLLLYKLLSLEVGGKMYNCLKNIYNNCKAGVNVNGYIRDSFSNVFWVRNGDALSLTLFGLYINDLVQELKEGSKGIQTEFFIIQCLLYANDIALISSSEQDLQNMLNILRNWCNKWRMKLNINKSNIVHFRNVNDKKSNCVSKYGECELEIVDKYKYLGIVLNEHLEYSMVAMIPANSVGRALGAIYNKYRCNKGFGYNTYTKLYHGGVVPILNYCSSVWSYCNLDKIDTVQNRALRLFLGVHKFAPNLSTMQIWGGFQARYVDILKY